MIRQAVLAFRLSFGICYSLAVRMRCPPHGRNRTEGVIPQRLAGNAPVLSHRVTHNQRMAQDALPRSLTRAGQDQLDDRLAIGIIGNADRG